MKKNVFVVLRHNIDDHSDVIGVYVDKKAAEFVAGDDTNIEVIETIFI